LPYPLRPHSELAYSSFHCIPIWPLASMLIACLVSDTYDASNGPIDFPAHFAEGYAYFRQHVHSGHAGRIEAADCRAMLRTMGHTQANGYVHSRALPGKFSKITFA